MSIKYKNISKTTVIVFGSSVAPGKFTAPIADRLTSSITIQRLIRGGILEAPKSGSTSAVATPSSPAGKAPEAAPAPEAPKDEAPADAPAEDAPAEPAAEEPKAEEPKVEEPKAEEPAPAPKAKGKDKGKKKKNKKS